MKTVNPPTEQPLTKKRKSYSSFILHPSSLILGFFVVLTLIMTWPVLPNIHRSIEAWGDALLQVWTLDWTTHALATNPANLFNANAFYPYDNALAFSETLVGQGFLVAPIIWLTNNPVLAYNLLLLASFVLSGWGTYLLVYDLTGKRMAGIIAGIIFAFFPHRYGQFSHLHLLATQWMPFCLLYLRRFMRQGRWYNAALFGLFFALEALSSTYLGLFLAVVVGLYLAWRGVGWTWQKWGSLVIKRIRPAFSLQDEQAVRAWPVRKLVGLGAALVVAGLVILPFYLPFLAVQQQLGFERVPSEVESFSAQPFYYLDVPKENKLNQVVYSSALNLKLWDSSRGGERGLYLGLGAMVLGLGGIVAAWRNRKRDGDGLFYVVLAIAAILLTFGPVWHSGRFGNIPLPYKLLYNFVPGFAGLRVPVRFIYVVALAVAVLAGFAVAWMQTRLKLDTVRRATFLAVPLIAVLLVEYYSDVSLKENDTLINPPPAATQWLASRPGPVLNVPLSGSDSSNLFYQYWSRDANWQPQMNGFSGFMPPAYDALKREWAQNWPSQKLINLLQGLEVRWLVLDTNDDSLRDTWPKVQQAMAQFPALQPAASFGSTWIYEIKSDPWIRQMKQWLSPSDPLYTVEYGRGQPQLMELVASYVSKAGVVKSEDVYGTIRLASRQLNGLPYGRKAAALLLQSGQDPTLYGFRPQDQIYSNALVTLYKSSPQQLARYDFTRTDPIGALEGKVQTIAPDGDKLAFNANGQNATGRYVSLAFAARATTTLNVGGNALNLQPGLTVYNVALTGPLKIEGPGVPLAWAELWQGTPPANNLNPRADVVLFQAETRQDGSTGTARIQLISSRPQLAATLDVYNYPYGSHPAGHYGYWSVAINGGGQLDYRLDLPAKSLATQFNGGDIPNYPPDPKDLDISKYGLYGDFRATFTLRVDGVLVGSYRLFDFTLLVSGDKSNAANRRLTDFKGYNTGFGLMVLPRK